MAGSRVPGPICATQHSGTDPGTSTLTCTPPPGPVDGNGDGSLAGAHHKSLARRVPGMTVAAGETAIRDALTKAISLLEQRKNDLDTWDEATQESFLTWFGTTEPAARAVIRRRIGTAMTKTKLKALRVSDFVAETPPEAGDFAYVFPNQAERGKYEMTVHLGPEFATADDVTRAGTFIHEVSHFVAVGHTDDVKSSFVGMPAGKKKVTMYGYSRAQRLSMKDPKGALDNADNFEFFIERQDPRDHFDSEGLGDFPQRPSVPGGA